MQWELRKNWNQALEGHRIVSASHPFRSPYISFLPSVPASSAFATAGHRAGGSRLHLRLRSEDSATPAVICSHGQGHILQGGSGPLALTEGEGFLSGAHLPHSLLGFAYLRFSMLAMPEGHLEAFSACLPRSLPADAPR